MRLKTLILLLMIFCLKGFAQVGISKDMSFRPDIRTQLHVKQDNEAVRLPRVDTSTLLPTSASGTTVDGTQASVIFNKETGSIVENDGTEWKISDKIVNSLKSNRIARFVRSSNITTDCGSCVICGLQNKTCASADITFTTSSPSFNDVPTSISLGSGISNIINIQEGGLYRVTFSSGPIEVNTAFCIGVSINLYSRLDLELSSLADTTFRPINKTVNSSSSGALSVSTLAPGAIDVGQTLAFTYVGTFNAGDKLRLKFYGNQNFGTGGCSSGLGSLNFIMNSIGAANSEIIVEKINMQ